MNVQESLARPMIYLGHPIRGKRSSYGKDTGVYLYENENCEQAIMNVAWLRQQFHQVRWYTPGECEPPIQIAHLLGFLTIPQILEMDFEIIHQRCSGGLLHKWEESQGLLKEIQRCQEWNYPHLILEGSKKIWECNKNKIGILVQKVIEYHPILEAQRQAKKEQQKSPQN